MKNQVRTELVLHMLQKRAVLVGKGLASAPLEVATVAAFDLDGEEGVEEVVVVVVVDSHMDEFGGDVHGAET